MELDDWHRECFATRQRLVRSRAGYCGAMTRRGPWMPWSSAAIRVSRAPSNGPSCSFAPSSWATMDAETTAVRRRAMDRERKRLVAERQRRMSGERRLQHVYNAILRRAGRPKGSQ